MFVSPGAIAIDTGIFKIHWYGIILAISFIIGQIIVFYVAKREYKDSETIDIIYDFAFWILLFGLIGARLYYVILSWNYYSSNINEIIMVQHGGLSIHGGIIFGTIAAIIYSKIKKINFFKYADLYALGLPIAQAIGRWGNFFNSEAFGLPTNLPWGVYISENFRPEIYKMYSYFHPTFLYESCWDIIIFLILYYVIKPRFFNQKGILFFAYLIFYSIGRICIEIIRTDSVLNIGGIPIAVVVSLMIILFASVGIYILKNNK